MPGELLPREADLCEHYDVSRVTVRAALRSLWDHGLISVRNGVGAVVLPNAKEVRHGLDRGDGTALGVLGPVHDAHPATAQGADDAVGPDGLGGLHGVLTDRRR